MRLACCIFVIAASAAAAHAEPVAKEPSRARTISIAATLGSLGLGAALVVSADDAAMMAPGVGLLLGGAVVGPSAGLWYAGHPGGKGIAIRAAALTVAAGAFVIGSELRYEDCRPFGPGEPTDDDCGPDGRSYRNDQRKVLAVLGAGALTYLVSTVYDIHASGRATRAWNADHGFSVGPTVIPAAGGSRAPGAMVSLRF